MDSHRNLYSSLQCSGAGTWLHAGQFTHLQSERTPIPKPLQPQLLCCKNHLSTGGSPFGMRSPISPRSQHSGAFAVPPHPAAQCCLGAFLLGVQISVFVPTEQPARGWAGAATAPEPSSSSSSSSPCCCPCPSSPSSPCSSCCRSQCRSRLAAARTLGGRSGGRAGPEQERGAPRGGSVGAYVPVMVRVRAAGWRGGRRAGRLAGAQALRARLGGRRRGHAYCAHGLKRRRRPEPTPGFFFLF